MAIKYDEHIIRAMAMLIEKLKNRASKKRDRVSEIWLEHLGKLIDDFKEFVNNNKERET